MGAGGLENIVPFWKHLSSQPNLPINGSHSGVRLGFKSWPCYFLASCLNLKMPVSFSVYQVAPAAASGRLELTVGTC